MAYFIVRECACGCNTSREVTLDQFNIELEANEEASVSIEGDNDTITYHVHSCKTCRAEQDAEEVEEEPLKNVPHVCGYCGSTKPLISYEEMYGPGAVGWPCCPDCGGV